MGALESLPPSFQTLWAARLSAGGAGKWGRAQPQRDTPTKAEDSKRKGRPPKRTPYGSCEPQLIPEQSPEQCLQRGEWWQRMARVPFAPS
jgi:hypothetical protein